MPSAQESCGLAALEAMACEVPVIASRVGGVPELVEDGVTGFLRAPEDLTGMASVAVRLLTDDRLHRQVAAAARTRAVACFADTKIIPMYEAYYDEILGAERAG
jgi:glycosyltransferase involved in cell wall biosynthesis